MGSPSQAKQNARVGGLAAAVAAALLFVLSGCGGTIRLSPDTGLDGAYSKIPADVAYLIDNDTKHYIYAGYPGTFGCGTFKHTIAVGQSVEQAGRSIFEQVFDRVTPVSTIEEAKQHQLVLEPKIEDFRFGFDSGVYSSIMKLRYTLTGGETKIIDDIVVTPDFTRHSLFVKCNATAEDVASQTVGEALKKAATNIARSRVIAEYLRSGGKKTTPKIAATSYEPATAPVISDVDTLPKSKVRTNPENHAIVIGIERYRQNLPKADFAVHDAETVAKYLTKVLGYPEENVITLLNDRALKSDMEKYFEKWLGNNVDPDSSVFIFYSGHGAPDPRTGSSYLVPYDGDPAFIDQTGYSLSRMYAALGKLPTKKITVALDSCFSGAGGRSVLAKGARPLVMNTKTAAAAAENTTVLSASAGSEISMSYDEKGHGLFTYFMLKAIKDEDVVQSDGSLSIMELYNFIKPQVSRIARKKYNSEQTPQLFESK